MSGPRVVWLIVADIHKRWRLFALVIGALFTVMFISFFYGNMSLSQMILDLLSPAVGPNFQQSQGSMPQKFHLDWFPIALFVVGAAVVSTSFLEYSNPEARQFHLMLPAKQFEKWLAKFTVNTLVFPIVFLILYQIFAWFTYRWEVVTRSELVRLDLLDPFLWKFIAGFGIAHCFIFLGSIIYTRYSLLKSLLAFMVILSGALAFLYTTLYIIVPNFQLANPSLDFRISGTVSGRPHYYSGGLNQFLFDTLGSPFYYISMTAVVVLALALSFLKFKEVQA